MQNLRSKPIDGYLMDGAGNQIRGAAISIKQVTVNGTREVGKVQTDPSGKFVTPPLKPGVYDIFESGQKVSRVNHTFDFGVITPFHVSLRKVPTLPMSSDRPNSTLLPLQIEPDDIDIVSGGHTFPMYVPISKRTSYWNTFKTHYYVKAAAAVTTMSKFNVEYHSSFNSGKVSRTVNWRGVRAVDYDGSTPLVIPLTFWDIVIDEDTPLMFVDNLGSISVGPNTTDIDIADVYSGMYRGELAAGDIIVFTSDAGLNGYGIITGYQSATGKFSCIQYDKYHPTGFLYNFLMGNTINSVSVYPGITKSMEAAKNSTPDCFTVFPGGM